MNEPMISSRQKVAIMAFVLLHACLIAAFFFPFGFNAFLFLTLSYFFRMFFVTAGYHRYFSHRAFSTKRWFQFFLAFMAQTSSQKGVLWWASHHRFHHRFHHRYSDQDLDAHTPKKGFFWSHCGWFLSSQYEETDLDSVKDFAKYPEILWLNRYWAMPVFVYGLVLFVLGGWSGVFWGLGVSTVLLWHGTFTINSLAHIWGKRRYQTSDLSRNNFFLALMTLGEGWHNNHHRFPGAARNGFFWWEVDLTFYVILILSKLGVVQNLRPVPAQAYRNFT